MDGHTVIHSHTDEAQAEATITEGPAISVHCVFSTEFKANGTFYFCQIIEDPEMGLMVDLKKRNKDNTEWLTSASRMKHGLLASYVMSVGAKACE